MQVIGNELAIRWDDGSESYVNLEALRRACPCAGCKGEVDVMGNLAKGPDIPLREESFKLQSYDSVGGYGIKPMWGDQHATGIFDFDMLKQIADQTKG